MDRLIRRFEGVRDGDLTLCEKRGVAYQTPMVKTAGYDDAYQEKVAAYDGNQISKAVNAGRVAMLARHLPEWNEDRSKRVAAVLDWGCGSGAFMRAAAAAGFQTYGYDINPRVQLALGDKCSKDPNMFEALTLWDTIEHLDVPEIVLRSVRRGAFVFASIPVFDGLRNIRQSKHYRPGEHLYYWTSQGFIEWMGLYGFRLLETSRHEIEAGRESIGAFAFKRDLPDYHEHIEAYKAMHSLRHYGASATFEYLDIVAEVIREVKPKSILDYGCGRSDLVAHFWLDGQRTIGRYDPAIGAYKRMPEGKFDITLCCDVLEHIPMADVDRVIAEIREKSFVAFFSISTILARAKLPDGRNAHVTLLSKNEWARWLKDAFGQIRILKGKHEHELVVLAGLA